MNATSVTAAKGLVDQDRSEVTTAVVTGSASLARDDVAGSGCASVIATALRITIAPTLSSASQTARGTWLAAPLVSSAVSPHASKPMNTQPPTASAASSAAKVEPPESDSAPSVSAASTASWSRKTEQQHEPDADRRDGLGRDADLDSALEDIDARQR